MKPPKKPTAFNPPKIKSIQAIPFPMCDGFLETLKPTVEELRTVFIVSKVSITSGEAQDGAYQSTKIPGLAISIDRGPGEKCERCWVHDVSVGTHETHKTVCSRCVDALNAPNSMT